MNRYSRTLLSAVVVAVLVSPAGIASAESLVITGGTIHPISAPPFTGDILIEEGLIVGTGAEIVVPEDARRIDASGMHVYPGFFDALSQLGLIEIGSVSATDDRSEMGQYNPHLQAASAIHPASEVLPVTRANGVTHTVAAPAAGRDGVIPGQGALIHLDGWTIEEMAIDPAIAMIIEWPEIQTRSFDFVTFSMRSTPFAEAKEKAEEAQNELRDWLDAARHYAQASAAGSNRTDRDLKLEALSAAVAGEQTVIVLANSKRDIEAAISFAEEEGLEMILAGGRDAWKLKELLAEKEIPVILGFTQSMPAEQDDSYDRPFRTAGELVEAGVQIAFASGAGGGFGPGGPHASRTLPYEAAMAVAYGLNDEDAMRALTLNPAEMLGVGDRLGSIENGKIANVIVTTGDPLEITTQVLHLVIDGREVSTDNRHKSLYERYRSR